MSVENMGNGYVKVGVKQEDLEAKKAQMQQTLRECISEYKKRLAG